MDSVSSKRKTGMEIVKGHISKGIVDIRIPCKHNLPRGIYEFACERIAVNESFCGDVSFFQNKKHD